MRIECPFCGERDLAEFTYFGDAGFRRPPPEAAEVTSRYYEALYLRENPAGPHQELWYHGSGCHSWLEVTRDTRTHEILAVRFATEAGE
jgi:heterotetrameric sarcosine oxidase delta subunit